MRASPAIVLVGFIVLPASPLPLKPIVSHQQSLGGHYAARFMAALCTYVEKPFV
jgi:hypothetical protein